MVIRPAVLVLARSQSDLTLGDGDFIRDGNTAMVLTAGTWQRVKWYQILNKTFYICNSKEIRLII